MTPQNGNSGNTETTGNISPAYINSANQNNQVGLNATNVNTNQNSISSVPPTNTESNLPPNNGSMFAVQFPSNVTIYLNFTSNPIFSFFMPNVSQMISSLPPETAENADTTTAAMTTAAAITITAATTTTASTLSTQTTAVTENALELVDTAAPALEKKYEAKCKEYNMNKRKARKAKVQVFIIGGTDTGPKEFPHMAALGYGIETAKEWLCGGSLVSENYVVTAAHCLSARSIGEVRYVRLGTTDLQTETLNSEDYNVINKVAHPDYIAGKQYNDIALLQLEQPVIFSEYIAPICLHDTKDLSNSKLIATGWGKTEAAGDVSPILKQVELEYFPNNVCQRSYSNISKQELPNGIDDERQLCAGSATEEKDTCQGDSGGPLQIQRNNILFLVGITSFGIGCGTPGSPGVYTRVSYYIPWIENIVWSNSN